MHDHPLHRVVTAECSCCGVEREFEFTSRHEHVLCKGCRRHQGDTVAKVKQRDFDHVKLWHSEIQILNEDHEGEVERLQTVIDQRGQELTERQTEIADLQRVIQDGFERTPPPTVENWLINKEVKEAAAQRDSAYRARDRAFRALWAVDQLHHEDEEHRGYCICGKRASHCKELNAIADATEALLTWENRERNRLRNGQPDGLPDNHPDVLKYGRNHYPTWH